MSEKATYTVTFVDGRVVKGEQRTADIVAFERRYQVPGFFLGDPDKFRIEYQMFMGYLAVTRGQETRPDFDVWLEEVDAVVFDAPEDDKVEGADERPPLDRTA